MARTKGVNYASEDLRERAQELGGERGIDVVYDPVGGRYAEPALRSLGWEGRYLVIGFAAGEIPKLPLNLVLLKSCDVRGVFWGAWTEREPDGPARQQRHLCAGAPKASSARMYMRSIRWPRSATHSRPSPTARSWARSC